MIGDVIFVAVAVCIGAPLAGVLGWYHVRWGARFPWERGR